MGQLLGREEEEEEEEESKQTNLQITWEQEIVTGDPRRDLHCISLPDAVAFPLLGLEEVRLFLTDNLTIPIEYNRKQRNFFIGKFYASPAEYTLQLDEFVKSSYVHPTKIMTIMGRSGLGKRSLVRDVCSKFSLGLVTLSTATDLMAFDFDKAHLSENSPSLNQYVLVIESSALESVRESLKTQQLVEQLQQLSLHSPCQSMIFLLHDYEAFERFNLHRVTGTHILNMYARVPNYNCRKQLISTAISNFEKHHLLAHMSNFVSFDDENTVIAIANASAWYTQQDIISFLDRCFNDVLIELIPYSNMERIPHTIPAVKFSDIVHSYLHQTRDVIIQRNKTNGYKAPVHPIYGERPYAINDQDVGRLSTPFENGFRLKAVDVEDNTWLQIINSRLYAKLQGISSEHKRKLDVFIPNADISVEPNHKPYESVTSSSSSNVTVTRQNPSTSFLSLLKQ